MILQLMKETAARGIEVRLHSPAGSATARVFALTGLDDLLGAATSSTASSSVT
jgi:hypothetical protein